MASAAEEFAACCAHGLRRRHEGRHEELEWSPSSPRWSPSRWSPRWSPSSNHRTLATGGPAGAAPLVAIALVAAVVADLVVAEVVALDLDVLAALVAIALVAAVVAELVTRAPARPGALVVAMRVAIALVAAPLDLDVLAAVSGIARPRRGARHTDLRLRGAAALGDANSTAATPTAAHQ